MLYGSMFALGYAIPLLVIIVLCGAAFVCWLRPVNNAAVRVSTTTSISISQTAAETTGNNGRHATRVVVVVVVAFALLQLPIHVQYRDQSIPRYQ